MPRCSLALAALFSILTLNSFTALMPDDRDWNDCLKKYESKWGEYCVQCQDYKNSYRVNLRNVCAEKIDAKVAVQESDKRWRTFIKTQMSPGDTMIAYACNGTGKYLYWVCRAGDKSTVLPSDEEINAGYSK